MSAHAAPVSRALRRAIEAFFSWPPMVLGAVMFVVLCVCYLVLPAWVGVPIVLLLAPLPWYEERLAAGEGERGALDGSPKWR